MPKKTAPKKTAPKTTAPETPVPKIVLKITSGGETFYFPAWL